MSWNCSESAAVPIARIVGGRAPARDGRGSCSQCSGDTVGSWRPSRARAAKALFNVAHDPASARAVRWASGYGKVTFSPDLPSPTRDGQPPAVPALLAPVVPDFRLLAGVLKHTKSVALTMRARPDRHFSSFPVWRGCESTVRTGHRHHGDRDGRRPALGQLLGPPMPTRQTLAMAACRTLCRSWSPARRPIQLRRSRRTWQSPWPTVPTRR